MGSNQDPSPPMNDGATGIVPPSRPPLPVMALRGKIVDKVRENRVTLIVGDTGCGKSSQVPQFFLEENMEPILCTQPRRFAVVAIARMVAKSRNCEVGGEIGYHIGHSNVSDMTSTRSRIVFKTAGVLLEQMRDKGPAALKYKVIILDEVHERSVESDLVLACVKQFMMKNNDLRVVLMSATADIARYRDYFNDLSRDERVEVIAIPSTSQDSIFQRKVLYLEQVADLLGIGSESFSARYCSDLNPTDADMKPEAYTLIHKLVLYIHEHEPDIQKSILIFLPTYYSLEQQWILLKPLHLVFKVHILHRSIDTDQALLAMRICKSHRKVILATNIAESSVTIPGVAYVIDSCRSLQVFWDPNRKTDSTELVWVSKSQAEQRRGRTGRTCDGQIYRLITGNFYNNLRDHENPAILRLSLRSQVLMICCAESKAINDPKVLLQKVMDPPESDIVEDALSLLVRVHALAKPLAHRGRYVPTFFGHLLDSLPLSFDASVLTLKFGETGLLREGILISILMDIQPLPILQPFGHPLLFRRYVDNFFDGDNNSLQTGKKETVLMGNLCAFQFWQRVFKTEAPRASPVNFSQAGTSYFKTSYYKLKPLIQNHISPFSEVLPRMRLDVATSFKRIPQLAIPLCSLPLHPEMKIKVQSRTPYSISPLKSVDKHRLERLKHILKVDEPKSSQSLIPRLEEEWCLFHNLIQTSLHNVSEIYEDIITAMHCFRPDFFATNELPSYFEPCTYKHTCLLQSEIAEVREALMLDNDNLDSVVDSRKCSAVPYVAPNDFRSTIVSERLKLLIKEIRLQFTEEALLYENESANDIAHQATDSALCRFFVKGLCTKGNQCSFSHSQQAKRPVCKFFLTFQGCRYGDSCFFSHVHGPAASITSPSACLQEERNASAYNILQLLPVTADGRVLVLNDKDLYFSSRLSYHYDPTKIIATTSDPYSSEFDASLPGITVLWDANHPCRLIIETKKEVNIPWNEVYCVLLFVDIGSDDAKKEHRMIQNFFEFLAIRILAETLYDLRVIITMNNIRFAQLQVERLARDCFFSLTQSFPFDESTFGKFSDPSNITRPMQVSAPFSYIFDMHPPTDLQFGDYATLLEKGLHNGQ